MTHATSQLNESGEKAAVGKLRAPNPPLQLPCFVAPLALWDGSKRIQLNAQRQCFAKDRGSVLVIKSPTLVDDLNQMRTRV